MSTPSWARYPTTPATHRHVWNMCLARTRTTYNGGKRLVKPFFLKKNLCATAPFPAKLLTRRAFLPPSPSGLCIHAFHAKPPFKDAARWPGSFILTDSPPFREFGLHSSNLPVLSLCQPTPENRPPVNTHVAEPENSDSHGSSEKGGRSGQASSDLAVEAFASRRGVTIFDAKARCQSSARAGRGSVPHSGIEARSLFAITVSGDLRLRAISPVWHLTAK